MKTCLICSAPAVIVYRPDMDMNGLGACKVHKSEVGVLYTQLLFERQDEYERLLKVYRGMVK
jgi:hypothetical protein